MNLFRSSFNSKIVMLKGLKNTVLRPQTRYRQCVSELYTIFYKNKIVQKHLPRVSVF